MPEWQRCKHREEQTEITDYIIDEQKPTKVAIDYGIQGNSPGPATATATRAKISNKLCKKLYWPWATFQLKMAEAKTSGQTEREREKQMSRQTGQIAKQTDGRTDRRADSQTSVERAKTRRLHPSLKMLPVLLDLRLCTGHFAWEEGDGRGRYSGLVCMNLLAEVCVRAVNVAYVCQAH